MAEMRSKSCFVIVCSYNSFFKFIPRKGIGEGTSILWGSQGSCSEQMANHLAALISAPSPSQNHSEGIWIWIAHCTWKISWAAWCIHIMYCMMRTLQIPLSEAQLLLQSLQAVSEKRKSGERESKVLPPECAFGSGWDAVLTPCRCNSLLLCHSQRNIRGAEERARRSPSCNSFCCRQWPSHGANNVESQQGNVSLQKLISAFHFQHTTQTGKHPWQTWNWIWCTHLNESVKMGLHRMWVEPIQRSLLSGLLSPPPHRLFMKCSPFSAIWKETLSIFSAHWGFSMQLKAICWILAF